MAYNGITRISVPRVRLRRIPRDTANSTMTYQGITRIPGDRSRAYEGTTRTQRDTTNRTLANKGTISLPRVRSRTIPRDTTNRTMAYGGSRNPPHGKTKVLYEFSPYDFGPLNVVEHSHFNNFEGGKYYVTTPDKMIKLYRLYGGRAREYGQYWGVEPRSGNLSYRYDAAVLDEWNTVEHAATLLVPEGVYMYEGQVSTQHYYLGGGWQVFIPNEIVQKLVKIQPHNMNGVGHAVLQQRIDDINRTQQNMMKRFHKEAGIQLRERASKYGSELRWLSGKTRQFILGNVSKVADSHIETGKYLIHRDSIPVMGGRRKNVSMFVRIVFDHSDTRTYQRGRTIVNETTHYYNRITEIEETV